MNLENKLFFRVVKVAYVLSLPAFFILMLAIFHQGWNEMSGAGDFLDWIAQKKQLHLILGCMIVIFPIYFSLINLTKETLIYLAFGRKFAWNWIDIIGYFIAIIMLLFFMISIFALPNSDSTKVRHKITLNRIK